MIIIANIDNKREYCTTTFKGTEIGDKVYATNGNGKILSGIVQMVDLPEMYGYSFMCRVIRTTKACDICYDTFCKVRMNNHRTEYSYRVEAGKVLHIGDNVICDTVNGDVIGSVIEVSTECDVKATKFIKGTVKLDNFVKETSKNIELDLRLEMIELSRKNTREMITEYQNMGGRL